MNKQKAAIICALVLAFAGTAVSVVFYQQAQQTKAVAEETEATVVELRQEVQQLQKKTVTVQPAVDRIEGSLLVDNDETIRDLEARLRAKDEELTMLYARVTEMESAKTNAPPRRGDRRSWMDDLKKSDPERYKEITERRESARAAAKYEVAKKAAYFLDRDTSAMSEQEAEEYSRMMNLFTDTLTLTEKLGEDLPREERRPIMHEFRDNLRDLSPMLDTERDKEFYQIGKDMGYADADAEAFATYLTEVVDLTSVQSIFRNAMGGMGGGRGGQGRN